MFVSGLKPDLEQTWRGRLPGPVAEGVDCAAGPPDATPRVGHTSGIGGGVWVVAETEIQSASWAARPPSVRKWLIVGVNILSPTQ